MPTEGFRYPGFVSPNFTPVPDDVFDLLMAELSGAEFKVLLYVIRRTFGFKKDADDISLNQLVAGITTKDGRVLDQGTGLSQSTVQLALKGLVEKNVIVAIKRMSREKGNEPTTYRLNLITPFTDNRQRGGPEIGEGVHRKSVTQETDRQETEEQETGRRFEDSNGHDEKWNLDRATIGSYLEDFAREFADQATLPSSVSRAVNLYHRSSVDMNRFIECLYAARARTKEYTGNIKATRTNGGGSMSPKPKMPYFFAVLEDLLDLKPSDP